MPVGLSNQFFSAKKHQYKPDSHNIQDVYKHYSMELKTHVHTQHDMVKYSYSYRIPTILCKQVLNITIAKIVLFRKQYLTTSR